VAAELPPWLGYPRPHPSDRRAKMLEHMARTRSLPQRQADPAPSASSARDILADVIGHAILFGVIALIFQSRISALPRRLYPSDRRRTR